MNAQEATVIRRMIRAALKENFTIGVYDGEEWCLRNSTGEKEIMEALGSTESDVIVFRNAEGHERVGTMWLIYGNSPEEVIADHTDNPMMEHFYKIAHKEIEA